MLTWLRLSILSITVAETGEYADATAQAKSLTRTATTSGDVFYEAAYIHALASKKALEDGKLAPMERNALAEQYAAEAVKLLWRSDRAGQYWDGAWNFEQHVKKDPALDSLRNRDDFKVFLEHLKEIARKRK
jgi:hypothetical protein